MVDDQYHVVFESKTNLPLVIQDFFAGIVNNMIVFSCGCVADKIEKSIRGRYFSKKTFSFKTDQLFESDKKIDYINLPDFPGEPRQKGMSVTYKDVLLCWGGLNYTPTRVFTPEVLKSKKQNTKSFNDGYALFQENNIWMWCKLPNLPNYMCAGAMEVVDNYIYLFGGSDYTDSNYNTWSDHENLVQRFGSRLFRISADKLIKFIFENGSEPEWEQLKSCPGTPRMNHVMINVADQLYVIGGVSGRPHGGEFYSIIDNWVYAPKTNTWREIESCPSSNTNWQNAFCYCDRYIFLIGGAHTVNQRNISTPRKVMNNDQTVTPGFGKLRSRKAEGSKGIMSCNLIAFDINDDKFIDIAGEDPEMPLPYDINNPMNFYLGNDKFVVFGGEIEITPKLKRRMGTCLVTCLTNKIIVGTIIKAKK